MDRKPGSTPPLTPKQALFIKEYALDHNATQAAIRAGYRRASAIKAGDALLRHPVVYGRLALATRRRVDRLDLEAAQTLERWRRIAGSNVRDLVDLVTGEPRRLADLPADVAYAIEACDLDAQGRITKVRLHSKIAALTFLSRHQELSADAPMPATTINHTEVYLSSLSTDELKVIERVMQRSEAAQRQATLAAGSDTPT